MKKKWLGMLVCLLFFGASIVSSINIQMQEVAKSSGGIFLYVGGSGPGNYTKIQDAIDNATSGDTVFVYNGVYYENVIVNKTINLSFISHLIFILILDLSRILPSRASVDVFTEDTSINQEGILLTSDLTPACFLQEPFTVGKEFVTEVKVLSTLHHSKQAVAIHLNLSWSFKDHPCLLTIRQKVLLRLVPNSS